MSRTQSTNPREYVRRNRKTLIEVVVNGSDKFTRALALAALYEYGDDRDIEDLRREIDDFENLNDRGVL